MKMKNKGICILPAMLILCTLLCVSAAAETGTLLREWRMEPKADGGNVSYLEMVTSAWNQTGDPLDGGNYENYVTVDKSCNNALGVDGSGAVSFRMKSFNNAKKFIAIADSSYLATKPGYTYFKSAMIKLNPENTDASNSTKTIYAIREAGGKGFIATAGDFSEKLAAYDGSGEIPAYDWLATKTDTPKYTITADAWTRVSEAVYRDESQAAAKERSGWVVWGKDWSTLQWTGNWEFLIDDYILLEVPNNALKSKVYPVISGGAIDKSGEQPVGTSLTASYSDIYDVNPMAAPSAKYRWQRSADGENFTDIEGAEGEKYTLSKDDEGFFVRAQIFAQSVPEDENGQKSAAVSSLPSCSGTVFCPSEKVTVSVVCGSGGTATVNGKSSDEVVGGSDCEISIVPDDGFRTKSIKINGADYTVASDNFSITVSENTVINIEFAEKENFAGIQGASGEYIIYQTNYKPEGSEASYPSFVAYFKISVPNGWIIEKYGLNLNGLDLEGKGISSGSTFGIRAYGTALVLGESYPANAYVKFADNDEIYESEMRISISNE